MVNGQKTPPMGRVEVVVRIGRIGAAVEILVLEMSGIDLLLGNDVLKSFKRLEIQYGDGKPKLRFGELPVGLLAEEQELPCSDNKIVVSKGRRIPPRAMAAVEVEQTGAVQPGPKGTAWMVEPSRKLAETKGVTAGRALMKGDGPTLRVFVVNLENRPKFIHQGTVLGVRAEVEEEAVEFEGMVEPAGFRRLAREAEGERTTKEDPEEEAGRAASRAAEQSGNEEELDLRQSLARVFPELGHEATENLVEDLMRFRDVFAAGNEQLGMCNVSEHEIPLTNNAKPIYHSLRASAYKEQLIQRELVTKMKNRGVIEVSQGP
jgi:hypothetical protein